MIYGEKIKQCLKTEQNPVNKMYLNDLLINWEKVENVIFQTKELKIATLVEAVSTYTKYLATPKFKYNTTRKCGFIDDHDVFKTYYIQDIVMLMLEEAGISEDHKGVKIKARPFCNGLSLQQNTYDILSQKPYLELTYSNNRHLSVGLEFDFNYRLTDKKAFSKAKIFIPLIIFFIEKHYTEKNFEELSQIRRDMVVLNPNAKLICITESVDKKLIRNYTPIKDNLYVLRCNFKNDPYKDLQTHVFSQLFKELLQFASKEVATYESIVPFGHISLLTNSKL